MHRSRFNVAPGAIAAIFLAGPIFILSLGIAGLMTPSGFQGTTLLGMIPVMVIAIPFGAVLALLPILFGGLVMGRIATIEDRLRHPIAWAAAGAAEALVLLPIFDALFTPVSIPFLLTGALCALVVRYGTCFRSDDSV